MSRSSNSVSIAEPVDCERLLARLDAGACIFWCIQQGLVRVESNCPPHRCSRTLFISEISSLILLSLLPKVRTGSCGGGVAASNLPPMVDINFLELIRKLKVLKSKRLTNQSHQIETQQRQPQSPVPYFKNNPNKYFKMVCKTSFTMLSIY